MTDIYVQKNGRPTAEDLLGTEYRIDSPVAVNLTNPSVDDLDAEIDKVKGKLLNANYTISLSAGSWPGNFSITDILTVDSAFFKILGDLRPHIGATYPQAADIITGSPWGSGAITLAKTDTNQITVTRATTNPDFAGIVSGDKVFIRHNAGADYYVVSSVTNGNEINLTTVAPDMSDYDTFETFVPDVEMANVVDVKGIQGNMLFEGIHFPGTYRQNGVKISNACDNIYIRQCFLYDAQVDSGRLHAQRYDSSAGAFSTIYDLALNGDAILTMNQSSLMGTIYPRDHAKIHVYNGHLSRMTAQDSATIFAENSFVLPQTAYHCARIHLQACTIHNASATNIIMTAYYGGKITMYNGASTHSALLNARHLGCIIAITVTNINDRNKADVSTSGMIAINGELILGSDVQIGNQGARLIDNSGTLTVRNATNDAYENIEVNNLIVNDSGVYFYSATGEYQYVSASEDTTINFIVGRKVSGATKNTTLTLKSGSNADRILLADAIILNPSNLSADVQVRAATDNNIFYVKGAGTGLIGVGTDDPGAKTHIKTTADEKCLLLEAHALLTDDIFVIRDENGLDTCKISTKDQEKGLVQLRAPSGQSAGSGFQFYSNDAAYSTLFQLTGGGNFVLKTLQNAMYIHYANSFRILDGSENQVLRLDSAGKLFLNDYQGSASDVNIKGSTDANLFYADVSADAVGIGTATPAEKLEVSGNAKITGNIIKSVTTGITASTTQTQG